MKIPARIASALIVTAGVLKGYELAADLLSLSTSAHFKTAWVHGLTGRFHPPFGPATRRTPSLINFIHTTGASASADRHRQ